MFTAVDKKNVLVFKFLVVAEKIVTIHENLLPEKVGDPVVKNNQRKATKSGKQDVELTAKQMMYTI